MTAPLQHPQKIYDFTNFSMTRPSQQQPGDRLDAQFEDHATIIAGLVDTIGNLTGQLITLAQLDPQVVADLSATIRASVQAQVDQATAAAASANVDAVTAHVDAENAASAAAIAQGCAALLPGGAADVTAQFVAAEMRANEVTVRIDSAASRATNAENDALLAAATAEDWADVSITWAEYLPEKIPDNILAISGITGDHWSSRWWANQASTIVSGISADVDAAQDAANDAANSATDAAASASAAAVIYDHFDDRYLGAKPSAPLLDNDGNALIIGSMYWNTATSQLFVWDGTSWHAVTTPSGSGIAASAVIFAPGGGLSSTNVQAALMELDAEKIGDAPADGAIYGRKNNAWIVSTSATIAWTDITGKPATFPPSAHTHPTSEIVGLDAAIANAATDADLAAEASARAAADTTLQTNINTVSTNLTTETTNRQNADTALQGQITANTTAIAGKVDEAPNDGKQYARKSLAWSQVVGGASIAVSPPSSPIPGQLWWDADSGNFYVYYDDGNSQAWVQVNARPLTGSNVFVSDTAPPGPPPGALWFESDSGNFFIWYTDANSSQWVQINYNPALDFKDYAAKVGDLKARPNILFNGDFSFSQKAGYALVNTNGAYFADGWFLSTVPVNIAAKVIGRQLSSSVLQEGRYRVQYTCTTAKTTLAATDVAAVVHHIEGLDLSPLSWGLAGGVPAVLRFGFKGPAGAYSAGLFDDTATNFWSAPFTITAGQANQDTIQVFAIAPPPATGYWVNSNVKSATLRIGLAAGSTYTGAMSPGGSWGSTNLVMPTGGFNFFSSTANVVEVFDVKLVGDYDNLGIDPGFAPTDFASEFARCQRYYQQNIFNAIGYTAGGSSIRFPMSYPVTMRANPVANILGTVTYSNASAATVTLLGPSACQAGFTVTGVGNGSASFVFELDANLV